MVSKGPKQTQGAKRCTRGGRCLFFNPGLATFTQISVVRVSYMDIAELKSRISYALDAGYLCENLATTATEENRRNLHPSACQEIHRSSTAKAELSPILGS